MDVSDGSDDDDERLMEGDDDHEDGEDAPRFTVADLMKQGLNVTEHLRTDKFQYELATKFFDRALELEPQNTDVLDEYADMLLQVGNVARAQKMLRQSIMTAPNSGYSKYMNMGQLMEGLEAVQCFEKGVQLMQVALNAEADPQGQKALKREMSNGLVNMAELWMTDLCYEPTAETSCEACVQRAIASDESNPDALQALASLRISQQRGEEALAALKRSYALWNPEVPDQEDPDEDAMQQGDDDDSLPLYGTRLAAAKMFIELGDPEDALEIVEGLVLENEDDPECYYLCGVCNTDVTEKKQNFDMALRKIAKLEKEGQGDLEPLKRVVADQMKKL